VISSLFWGVISSLFWGVISSLFWGVIPKNAKFVWGRDFKFVLDTSGAQNSRTCQFSNMKPCSKANFEVFEHGHPTNTVKVCFGM